MTNNKRGEADLTNPNATKEAKILYNYIRETYGHGILAGQQESARNETSEFEFMYIKEKTGKLPAVRGLDYIDEDYDSVTQRAIAWWEKGGIVSICWHWGTPPHGVGYESSKGEIDIHEALTEGTDLHKGMLAQMDRVAEELKKLQNAGVPVLWRPFHEFDGQWFWWGKGGAECFIRLWRLMYNRYTHHHGLNNLLWVLGYSGEVKDGWYPGDAYVDICGSDNYAEGIHADGYSKVLKIAGPHMPLAYHENGPLPDPDTLVEQRVNWVWFLTWHTIHLTDQNTPEWLKKVYHHPYVITLDKLPRFTVK